MISRNCRCRYHGTDIAHLALKLNYLVIVHVTVETQLKTCF
jgi:hypothetical protein